MSLKPIHPAGRAFKRQVCLAELQTPHVLLIFCFKEPIEPKADRPAWMEELRSKQAHRKSGLFGKER